MEEKIPWRYYSTFQYLKGAYKRAGERLLAKVGSNGTRGNGFTLEEGRLRKHIREKSPYCEGVEALKKVAQCCGCPTLGSVQGQMGFEQLGLGQGVPAHGKGLK